MIYVPTPLLVSRRPTFSHTPQPTLTFLGPLDWCYLQYVAKMDTDQQKMVYSKKQNTKNRNKELFFFNLEHTKNLVAVLLW